MSLIDPRPVSGRYRGVSDRFEVELRVDVDGPRPTNRASADYYRDGDYYGSMCVDEPTIARGPDELRIGGRGRFNWATRFTTVQIAIPRVPRGAACAPAKLAHVTSNGVQGSEHTCAFESPSFRTAALEEACEQGVTPLRSYDTGALPSRGPRRELSHVAAFDEAGVELDRSGPPLPIDMSAAEPGATWSDAELLAAMQQHFTRLADGPRWAVWMLHASCHDTPGVIGLMFDRSGPQRQGCAVFYGPMSGPTADDHRLALHTCVHELGHAFNLLHCWQKSLARPPVPSRPDAASWMNYPGFFPGGERAYWPRFAFTFDNAEVIHLRHAFRETVIPGGTPFTGGAAAVGDHASRARGAGLRLALDAPQTLPLGMPVTCAVELAALSRRGQQVPLELGPRPGSVDMLICPPGDDEFVFDPLLRHCRGDESRLLRAGDAPVRDYPFIHYGRNGFAFDEPGLYRLRARYAAADGSELLSNPATIRVLAPVSRADRAVAKLIQGNEGVGMLLAVMGSGAPELRAADATLQDVIERFPGHPFADIARLVRGASLGRAFKTVQADGSVVVRPPDVERARLLVDQVVDVKSMQAATGRSANSREAVETVTRVGTRPGVSPAVMGFINSRRREIATVLPALPPLAESPGPVESTRFDSGGRFPRTDADGERKRPIDERHGPDPPPGYGRSGA